ncbi:MAG: hypothetical protein AB7S36_00905, partial [Planctomycetota bacterium]
MEKRMDAPRSPVLLCGARPSGHPCFEMRPPGVRYLILLVLLLLLAGGPVVVVLFWPPLAHESQPPRDCSDRESAAAAASRATHPLAQSRSIANVPRLSDDNAPGPDAIEPQRERLLFIHDAAAPDVPTSGDVYLWHDCDRDSAWIEVVPVPASGLPVARLDLQAIPFGRTRAGGIFIVSWHLIEGDAAEVATPPDIHVVGAPPGVGYFSPALLDPDRRATVARWCAPWHGYIEATYQGEPRVATLHARMPWYRAPDDDEDGRFVRRIDALGLPEWLEAPLSAGPTPIVALCMAWEDQPPSHPLDNIEADYDRWWF